MHTNAHEPKAIVPAPSAVGKPDLDGADLSTFDNDEDDDPSSRAERHDGWTGQRMAMFCALLAETGIVSDACHAVGMSRTTAYGARRRSPLFAAAWEESLAIARNRLADELLERSLTGSVEKFYRDGELVAEKRIVDNKLGMAILRRLDRMAETGLALHSNLVPAVRPQRSAPSPTAAKSPDWDLMLSALRTGDEDLMAEAMVELRAMESDEADKADNPPIQSPGTVNVGHDEEAEDAPRCWWDEDDDCWMTDFPPPPGFDGHQEKRWGEEDYKRECTPEECRALEAWAEAENAEERAEDEALRDRWFAELAAKSSKESAACA